MLVIRRYSSAVARANMPIATKVAPETSQCNCNLPNSGTGTLQWRAMNCFSSPGQKYDAYPANPIDPDAIESGALKESCHTKRKETRRPRVFARKFRADSHTNRPNAAWPRPVPPKPGHRTWQK